MSKDLNVGILLDYYGDLLTETQKGLMELYYNEDLSLSEIAVNSGITRQGVYDSIKRSEELMQSYEQKLELYKEAKKVENIANQIEKECLKMHRIGNDDMRGISSRIRALVKMIKNAEE